MPLLSLTILLSLVWLLWEIPTASRKFSDVSHILCLLGLWSIVPMSLLRDSDGDPINIVAPVSVQKMFRKIQDNSSPLLRICEVYNGVKPFEKGKGNPPQTAQVTKQKPYVREGSAPDSTWSPLLRGSLIYRYENRWDNNYWISYGPWLAAPRDPYIFEAPLTIVVRQIGDSIIATLVEGGYVARNNLHIVLSRENHDLRYVLGLMNSKLIDFAHTFMNPEKGEALAEVKKRHVEQLPIRTIDFSNPQDVARHDRMVELVERMLALHKKLAEAKIERERTIIQHQIDASDGQIDRLVYELYGLTEEEVAIVEGSDSP
jgi:adenine-specific DNA-methyltransferase